MNDKLFEPMADILKPGAQGGYRLEHYEISEEDARFERMRSTISFSARNAHDLKAGRYVRLKGPGGTLWMSDTPMEQQTQRFFVHRAQGEVLILGLGLGLGLIPVLRKPEVTRVLVIEKAPEVGALVVPQLQRYFLDAKQEACLAKLEVRYADAFDIAGSRKLLPDKFDTIWVDIWAYVCGDNWDEMKKLKRGLRGRLKPGGYMGCWEEEACKYHATGRY